MKQVIFSLAAFSFAVIAAQADWDPGDPYKMHNPQMPDENGWDINVHDYVLADDWQCSETGPVTDVHFWLSWQGDGGDPSMINTITLSIHDDVPADPGAGIPFSHPGQQLWGGTFTVGQFIGRGPFAGDQGFAYEPDDPSQWVRPDHSNYWQINITNIQDAFVQQEGTIYWLDVNVQTDQGTVVGWKTSLDHWNDQAVFWDDPSQSWLRVIDDPITGDPIDMSFVITTPEPQSAMLAVLGFGLLCLRRKR